MKLSDMIFFDPQDKRIFPPKKVGVGVSINFGHPVGIGIVVLLVAILIFTIVT